MYGHCGKKWATPSGVTRDILIKIKGEFEVEGEGDEEDEDGTVPSE